MADFTKAFNVSSPAGSDLISAGDDNIRDFKTAVGERIGLEHYPFLNALGDMTSASAQGRHKPGYTSAVYIGTTLQIAALSGMTSGCLAFDTDLNVLKIYSGSDWTTRTVGTGNHAFCLRKTTGTMVATTNTKVTFDVEDFDLGGAADLANSKYVVPVTGIYLFQFATSASSTTYKTQASIYKNGTWVGIPSAVAMAYTLEGTNVSMINGSTLLSLTANDYIELFWLHENGGTKTVTATLSGFKVF